MKNRGTDSNFELNKDWIRHNISRQLCNVEKLQKQDDMVSFDTNDNNETHSTMYNFLYNTGLKYKHIIKKSPLLYRFSMKLRYHLFKKMNRQKLNIESINLFEEISKQNGIEYISSLYHRLLNRQPDNQGLKNYLILLNEGISKDIIFDLFIRSNEYKLINQEKRFNEIVSKKDFYLYKLKRFAKKIPLIWFYRFLSAPVRLKELSQEYGIYTMINEFEKKRLRDDFKLKIDEVQNKHNQLLDELENINKATAQFGKTIQTIMKEHNELKQDINIVVNKIAQINEGQDEIVNGNKILRDELNEIQTSILSRIDKESGVIGQIIEQVQTDISVLRNNTTPSPITSPANITVIQLDNFMIGVPSEEWRLASYMHFKGHLEPGLVKLFSSMVKRGMTIVDIGANIGIYTLLAARNLYGEGKIYSFEPTPRIYNILKNNIQLNGFLEQDIIRLNQVALSDKEGVSQFAVFNDNCGHNSLFPKSLNNNLEQQEIIEVSTRILDEVLGNGEKIDIVKLDAEGAEPFILRGMQRTIATNPEISIFMEFAPEHILRSGVDLLSFIQELEQVYHFTIKKVDDISGEIVPVSINELLNCNSMNLYLSRKESEILKQ